MKAIAGRTVEILPRINPPAKATVKIRKLPRPDATPPLADINSERAIISRVRITKETVGLAIKSFDRSSGDKPMMMFAIRYTTIVL